MKKLSRRDILGGAAVGASIAAVLGGPEALQLGHQLREMHDAGEEGKATGPGVQQGFFALEGYAAFAGEQFGAGISFPHNYGQSGPVVTQSPFFNWNVKDYVIARPNPFGALVTVIAQDIGEFYCEFIWTATPQ